MATEHTYPPTLGMAQLRFLTSEILNWSILHGLAVRPPDSLLPRNIDLSGVLAVTAPVTLFPSPFPRKCFEEARAIQTAYNELYVAIASDEEWLSEIVEALGGVDDFIENLWNVHLAVKEEGYVQDITLGIFRSDYMIDHDDASTDGEPKLKQVEFNTIASSFGGLAVKVSALHRHLFEIGAYPDIDTSVLNSDALPLNPATERIANGLADAHKAYGTSKSKSPLPLCVLFVVQEPENNVFDQLAISAELQASHRIRVFRLPLHHTARRTSIPTNNPSRPLIYTPSHSPSTSYEVTTLYFRAGYSPRDYAFPEAWEARFHLERSAAIKCPSILTHLAGSKKVQQRLASPAPPFLNHFLPEASSKESINRIEATFTSMYSLSDSPEALECVQLLVDKPEVAAGFVMKPQREGGGNNIYGAKISSFLASIVDKRIYRSYIIMKMIEPPSVQNSIYRNGLIRNGEVIGELGIYGICLWRNGDADGRGMEMLENYEGGFLLRTKGRESEEGGVAAGFGSVDSVCLVD